jgi:ceramide glucosyltransferase
VTVLKPLYGGEPLLEQGLRTLFQQYYPDFQIVFGVADPADPAAGTVRRLQAEFPGVAADLAVDGRMHGPNRKVGNLINMFPLARHDIVVIADSDVHVRPDYLSRLVAPLADPGVGLVTTLYAGLPAGGQLPSRLGATQITHGFLPGALLARALGRQDCLGATMCLRRAELERIGGLRSLVDHLADDNVLGRRIQSIGMRVALADTVPLTTVPEASLGALFQHELRWARTIRTLEPAGFAASVLQYPLFWAVAAFLLSGGALWAWGTFLLAWLMRTAAALWIDISLAPLWLAGAPPPRSPADLVSHDNAVLAFSCPVWLLPLRDILSVAVFLASYGGRHVIWRGQGLEADTPPPIQSAPGPIEGKNLR